jgi:hypothetical protein
LGAKVFISYAGADREHASAFYRGLVAAGVEVFNYEYTARPGADPWDEVLGWIESCDTFLVLLSRHALKSRAVAEEIKYAHHQNVNAGKPRLIPALLEADVEVPRRLRALGQLPAGDTAKALEALLIELGVQRAASGPAAAAAPAAPAAPAPAAAPKPPSASATLKRAQDTMDAMRLSIPPVAGDATAGTSAAPWRLAGPRSRSTVPLPPSTRLRWPDYASHYGLGLALRYIAAIVAVGIAAALVAYLVNHFVVLRGVPPFGFLGPWLAGQGRWTGGDSFVGGSLIVGGLMVIGLTWAAAIAEIPINVGEYTKVAILAAAGALVLGWLWVDLTSSLANVAPEKRVWVPSAWVLLTTATLSALAIADEWL